MAAKNFSKILQTFLLVGFALLLTGCPNKNDNIYPVAEEDYLIGWVLHNIDDSTPTELTFSKEDLAIYTYSYNYPADNSITYDNVLYWIAPFQTMASTFYVRLGVPQDRVYYLKGDNVSKNIYSKGWSFFNIMSINYQISNNSDEQFGLNIAHEEHYKSENTFDAISPIPGVEEHIYFGTSPFTPASIILNDNIIRLNDHLLKGYGRNSYLKRQTLLTVLIFDGTKLTIKEVKLPVPTYKIYLDGNILQEGNLTNFGGIWDFAQLSYFLKENGNYEVEINIPSGYPVFSDTKIKTSFVKDGTGNIELPVLKHIEFPPNFKINERIPISVEFENNKVVEKVSMFYKADTMQDWKLAPKSLIIKDLTATKIDFKIEVTGSYGDVVYEISPISLRSLRVDCSHQISSKKGEASSIITGRCEDELEKAVKGIKIDFYSDNEFLGSAMTDLFGNYNLQTDSSVEKLDFKFEGTGIYLSSQKACIDTDGGQDYFERGAVTYPRDNKRNLEDYCYDNLRLFEYWCGEVGYSAILYDCPLGCKKGVCVREAPSEDPLTCGNGIIDQGETCDGDNFNGINSCSDFSSKFAGGDLECTADCQISTENCFVDEENEEEE